MVNNVSNICSLPTEILFDIFGLIPDNLSKAQFSLTCTFFKEIADGFKGLVETGYKSEQAALVQAVAKWTISPEEAYQYGITIPASGDEEQRENQGDEFLVQKASGQFYEVFKNRCVQLNVDLNSNHFSNYFELVTTGLIKQIKTASFSKSEAAAVHHQEKMGLVIQDLSAMVFNDIVGELLGMEAEAITIQAYVQKVRDLRRVFPQDDVIIIEANLRQDLKAKHGQDFRRLSSGLFDPNPANPKVAEIQEQMKLKFEGEKAAIEAVLLTLRGSNGWNGTIRHAAERKAAALAAVDAAKVEFLHLLYGAPSDSTSFGSEGPFSIESLLELQLIEPSEELLLAKAIFTDKLSELYAAREEYDDLIQMRAALVKYDSEGRLVAGCLAQVLDNLNPVNLYCAARIEATKIGKFYYELNVPMTEKNKERRYNALHKIIGSYT